MNLASIPSATSLFLDANVLIYHFASDPSFGAACTDLLERVELGDLTGHTSSHVLAEVCHKLMCLEAMNALGWPGKGIAFRLNRSPDEIKKLSAYQQAMPRIKKMGI